MKNGKLVVLKVAEDDYTIGLQYQNTNAVTPLREGLHKDEIRGAMAELQDKGEYSSFTGDYEGKDFIFFVKNFGGSSPG